MLSKLIFNNFNILIEKPLCIYKTQLIELKKSFKSKKFNSSLTVGFNRRFSDLSKILKEKTNGFPVYISIDINAGSLPFDHWTLDREIGGGRLLGEVCHFIDLALYITDKKIISVSCNSSKTNDPSYFLTINFVGGSIANVRYLTNGFTNNIRK